jgi:hypothetical protein
MKRLNCSGSKQRRRGLAFASLNEEELTKKIRGETSKSPFFYLPGVDIRQPLRALAAYVRSATRIPTPLLADLRDDLLRLANFAADITTALAGQNPGWPYVSDAPTIVAAKWRFRRRKIHLHNPNGRERNLSRQWVLWQPRTLDVGTYLDRSFFEVRLIMKQGLSGTWPLRFLRCHRAPLGRRCAEVTTYPDYPLGVMVDEDSRRLERILSDRLARETGKPAR